MTAGTPPERFEAHWRALLGALDREDDAAALRALQGWIEAWDECFWGNQLDVFAVAYAPDVEILNRTRFAMLPDFEGLDAFRRFRFEAADVLSNFRFEVTSMRRRGSLLLGLGRFRTRGRYTGIVFRFPVAVLWTIEGGLITRIETYSSQRKALAAIEAQS